jgi:glutamine---fructose-6-phosphate transaminase (isomerizing)
MPEQVTVMLAHDAPARVAAAAIGGADGLVAIGRGFLLSVALEAALKLKETALLLAEGLSAADFRHGPIAVMQRGFPVLALSFAGAAAADMAALEETIRARGAPLLRLSSAPGAELSIPAGADEALAPLLAVVRAQQLAREVALARGLDPDSPPGLTKVTPTAERPRSARAQRAIGWATRSSAPAVAAPPHDPLSRRFSRASRGRTLVAWPTPSVPRIC